MEGSESGNTLIPDSLKWLMHYLVDQKGRHPMTTTRRCTAAITFHNFSTQTQILHFTTFVGTSVSTHPQYASREPIDILSNTSFTDDYKEVQRFEHAPQMGGHHMVWVESHNLCMTTLTKHSSRTQHFPQYVWHSLWNTPWHCRQLTWQTLSQNTIC